MVDDRAFRTVRGRGVVADGRLRVERSPVELLRGAYREKWTRNDPASKVLALFSFAGMAMLLRRVAGAVRALLRDGAVSSSQWLVLGAIALVTLAVVRKLVRTADVPLRRIESVTLADRTLGVEYAEDGDAETLEIDARTEDDAAQAVELLRFKGVQVENRGEDAGSSEEDESEDDASVSYDILGRS